MDQVDSFLQSTVGEHYMIASAAILVLLVLLIICYFSRPDAEAAAAEGYRNGVYTGLARTTGNLGEGNSLRFQEQDQSYVGKTARTSVETMEGGDAAPEDRVPSWAMTPAQQILASPSFGCNKRNAKNERDAWAWMTAESKKPMAASEGMRNGLSDSEASALLAGQNLAGVRS